MVHVVTYTTKSGYIEFCGSSIGLARHTTKADAQRTLEKNLSKPNATLREFANMKAAGEFAALHCKALENT